MEFRYSSVVDPSTYDTQGLCDGIPVRYHRNAELEEIGILKCHKDWRKSMGPLGLYGGCFGPRWNFLSVTVPECLPERLEILGYLTEAGLLFDDVIDMASPQGDHGDYYKSAFKSIREGDIGNGVLQLQSGKGYILMHAAREMIALSEAEATTTIEGWLKAADEMSRQPRDEYFKTEVEYLEYRMKNVGSLVWYGIVTFGMGIIIPKEEVDIAHELSKTAYLSFLLGNDFYSYQKEYEAAQHSGRGQIVNIILVLMSEHDISEAEAKILCMKKLRDSAIEYQRIVRDAKERTDISPETKRYLEALLYTISGNLAWSSECPRYHGNAHYNARQLRLVEEAVTRSKRTSSLGDSAQNARLSEDTTLATLHGHDTSPAPAREDLEHIRALLDMVGTGLVLSAADLRALSSKKIKASPEADHSAQLNGIQKSDLSQSYPPQWDTRLVEAPYQYLVSLPSKGVREMAIRALNDWLDDLQDGSQLRRGKPSTHTVFGLAQTVNSANYHFLIALEEMQKLGDTQSMGIFMEEVKSLHIGQSLDIHWTQNLVCPSVEEYFQMVEGKTGGLFRVIGRLMSLHATASHALDMNDLCNTLGRFYQIRDDYQNLYTEQKGFCEDLDEGKYSLPVIHLMQTNPEDPVLRNIWMQRRANNGCSVSHKRAILAMMHESGSLLFTAEHARSLQAQVLAKVGEIEALTGARNAQMRMIMKMLEI
ncbi:putative geranylgeranyl diphosphate synthase [Xylariaceae sp. FL0594]|nr:putative geranylgeranyl diphosphate synthase [Xylariaceae sp. FL0594]